MMWWWASLLLREWTVWIRQRIWLHKPEIKSKVSLQEGKGINSMEACRAFGKTSPLKSTKSSVSDRGLEWLLRGLDPVGGAYFLEMHHYSRCMMFTECPLRGWHCNYLFRSLCLTLLWFLLFLPLKTLLLLGISYFFYFQLVFQEKRQFTQCLVYTILQNHG